MNNLAAYIIISLIQIGCIIGTLASVVWYVTVEARPDLIVSAICFAAIGLVLAHISDKMEGT